MGGLWLPQSLSSGQPIWEVWEETIASVSSHWRLRQNSFSLFYLSFLIHFDSLANLLQSCSGWHTSRNLSWYSLVPLPISAPAFPWPSWSYPCTARLSPLILPRMPVHCSTACAFASCPLVWPEVPFSLPCQCPSFLAQVFVPVHS